MDLPALVDDDDALLPADESNALDGLEGNCIDDESEVDEEEMVHFTSFLKGLYDEEAEMGDAVPRVGVAGLSAADIVVYFLDWMHVNKMTDAAAEQMWSFVQGITPTEFTLPRFSKIKRASKHSAESGCRKIDLCPNDCIAYFDSVNITGPSVVR
jgi:hypothetical protein